MTRIKDPGPVPDVSTTTALDLSVVGLKGVSGRGTTTIPMGPGGANLSGTVTGPEGPIAQATVHIERLVENGTAVADVASADDGTWSLPAVFGGRYRVRAWRAPDLALTTPEIFYIQSSENKIVNLRVDRYAGGAVMASIAPDPPVFGERSNLFVLVTQKTVEPDGVVRGVPVDGVTVELGGSGFQVETPNPATTDANGVVEWRVRCTSLGQGSLSVTLDSGGSFPLTVAACVDASSTSTATTESGSTTTLRRTTSTTRRG